MAKSVNMMRSAWRCANRDWLGRLANEWDREHPRVMERAERWFSESFGRPARAARARRCLFRYAESYLRRHA